MCSRLVILVWIGVAAASVSWDGEFSSRRFSQRYRVQDGKIWAENEVTINAAPGRVWHELQGPWLWWTDRKASLSDHNETATHRELSAGWLTAGALEMTLPKKGSAFKGSGTLTGVVAGPVSVEVVAHPVIPRRSVLRVTLEGGVSTRLLVSADLAARGLLWACRGELTWFSHVRGFSGLIRKLEGFVGSRYNVLEEGQLDALVHQHNETGALLWTPTMDTSFASDDRPSVEANSVIDLTPVLSLEEPVSLPLKNEQGEEEEPPRVLMQFLLQGDPEPLEDPFEHGWSLRSSVKINFLIGTGDAEAPAEEEELDVVKSPLSFVFQAGHMSLRVKSEQADGESGTLVPLQAEMVVGALRPVPPGEMRLVRVAFQANWTVAVTLEQEAPVEVVIPEHMRDDVSLENIVGLQLRSNVRTRLHHVLVTDDAQLFEEVGYFSERKALAVKDAHSLGSSNTFFAPSPVAWTTLALALVALLGVPLVVTRLASFDSGLIPKKGFDKPLLYFRLAPSAVLTHVMVSCSAGVCLLLSLLLHWNGTFPTLVYALTLYSPQVLIWRVALTVLFLQRLTEAYLGFKTYIDKLTEKSFRVAYPLFDFQFWLWMNRVSLVSHVLETLSLLVMSLSSPLTAPSVQHVAWVLFNAFHLVHVVSHFRTFSEIKRSYQDGLVEQLRLTLNMCVACIVCGGALRISYSTTGLAGLDSAAALAEWAFMGVNFYWHHMVQLEFIAPEDTRLYVGRRIAFGSSVRCSECFRPFSRARPRETCADCRDECCRECGTEMHMSEVGSMVDLMFFCCSKCHRLLQAEMSAHRDKGLTRRRRDRSGTSSNSSGSGSNSNATSASEAHETEVCRMYQYGECTYGDSCRYVHSDSRRHRAGSEMRRRDNSGGASRPSTPAPHADHASLRVIASPSPSDSDGNASEPSFLDSSLESSLSSIDKKKRRRGKRGRKNKKPTSNASSVIESSAGGESDEGEEPQADVL